MTPYYFLPSVAGFNVGLLSYIGVPVHIQLFLICNSIFGESCDDLCETLNTISAMIIAILALFETRSSSIQENMFKIQRQTTRFAYYSVNFVFQTSVLIPMFSSIPENQESAKLQILESFPCPTREFFTSPTFVVLTDPFWTNYILYYMTPAICISGCSQTLFYAFICVYYLYVAPSNATSPQTRKMQQKWFMGLCLQCAIPLAIFAIPYSVALVALIVERFTQTMMNSLVVVFGFHGVAESVVIIVVHKSYREGFKQMFTKRDISSRNSQIWLRNKDDYFRSSCNWSVF